MRIIIEGGDFLITTIHKLSLPAHFYFKPKYTFLVEITLTLKKDLHLFVSNLIDAIYRLRRQK